MSNFITLQQAFDSFTRRKKDTTDVDQDVFIEWCQFIQNFLYRSLLSTDPERYLAESTYNVVSGTQAYNLPADFRDMKEMNAGIFLVDSNGIPSDIPLALTNSGSQRTGAYIRKGQIFFTPIPPSSQTYLLRYAPFVVQFSAMTDNFSLDGTTATEPTCPAEYLQHLVNSLDVAYTVWDEVEGAESLADARMDRSLTELFDNFRKETDVYTLPDPSSAF